MTAPPPGWDAVYEASTPAPWDIGRPQPAFVRLADRGLLSGRVLDAGCGTGWPPSAGSDLPGPGRLGPLWLGRPGGGWGTLAWWTLMSWSSGPVRSA
jgi:hypothetical protein